MQKISTGTIARTIALLIVLLNVILRAAGKPLIDIEEGTILYWVEYLVEIAVVIVSFWKNNSFTPAAIKADAFLQQLRNGTAAEEYNESEGVE